MFVLLFVGMIASAAVPAFATTSVNTLQLSRTWKVTGSQPANGFQYVSYVQTRTVGSGTWGPKAHTGLLAGSCTPSFWGGSYYMGWAFDPVSYMSRMTFGQQAVSESHSPGEIGKFKITLGPPFGEDAGFTGYQKKWTYQFGYTKTVSPFTQWGCTTWLPGKSGMFSVTVGSQPGLANPATMLDDNNIEVANTVDLVVTNIQYAESPSAIPQEQLDLDDSTVQALFASSPDAVRPGPIVIAPGGEVALSAMPSSIGDPEMGGSTLLMKCEVENVDGEPMPLVMQFINDSVPTPPAPPAPTSTPASAWWSLLLVSVAALALAVGAMRSKFSFRKA